MKTFFCLLFLIIAVKMFSQNITVQQNSLTAGASKLSTGNNPIHRASRATSSMVQSEVMSQSDSVTNYNLNFYTPPSSIKNNNTQKNVCIITDDNGNTIKGVLKGEMQATDSLQKNTCSFTKADFYKIAALKNVKQIKIISSKTITSFSVDNDLEETIVKQAKALLNAIKNQKK